MKKDRTGRQVGLYVWVIVVALLFLGCGTAAPTVMEETGSRETDVIQSTQMTTEIPNTNQKPDESDGFVHSYPLGTTVSYDLNGDGIDEEITVDAQEYANGRLTVGNTSVEFMTIDPTGYFTVINVDQSQKILLIGVSDYGFSDDDMTILYAYDGERIAEVGIFEDILGKNSYGKAGAICHGDGTISARVRMDVLGTWTAMGLYRLGEAGLEDHTELYRRMDWEDQITGWEVTTKIELTMYKDCDQTGGQITIPAGTMVRMTGVERGQEVNTHWVCFEVDSMNATLWLLTEEIEWQTFVYNGEKLLDSEAVFDGFFYAG